MIRCLPLVVLCLACIGCGDGGPPLGSVSGTVTMDGQPLGNALVTFSPVAGGRSSTGKTDASGNYKLSFIDSEGAVIGSHNVSVTTLKESASSTPMSSDDPNYGKPTSPEEYERGMVEEAIPERYNTKTELVKDVTSGSNSINLELTSS